MAAGRRLRSRQAEKPPDLIRDVVEVVKSTTLLDHVQQVAVLAGGCVSLMCS
jgi:hypothetical protein